MPQDQKKPKLLTLVDEGTNDTLKVEWDYDDDPSPEDIDFLFAQAKPQAPSPDVEAARRRLEILGKPKLETVPAVSTATTLTKQEAQPSIVEKTVMGVVEPVVAGVERFGAGVRALQRPTSGEDILRGAADVAVGALETGISSIPAMAAVNAGMAVGGEEAVKAGGELISGVSSLVADVVSPELDKKILDTVSKATGEKFTEKGLGYAVAGKFGLPVLVGAVLADATGTVADKILNDTSLSEEDRKRISDLVHHTAFFAGMGATSAAKGAVTGLERDIERGTSEGIRETGRDLARQQGEVPSEVESALRARERTEPLPPQSREIPIIQPLEKPIPAIEEPSPILTEKGGMQERTTRPAFREEAQRSAQEVLTEAERKAIPFEGKPEARRILEPAGETTRRTEPLPEFKTTDEAIEFGRKNPEQAEALEAQAKELSDQAMQMIREKGNPQEVIRVATRSQYAREAAEFARDPKKLTPIEEFEQREAAEKVEAAKPPVETGKPAEEPFLKEMQTRIAREESLTKQPINELPKEVGEVIQSKAQEVLAEIPGFKRQPGSRGVARETGLSGQQEAVGAYGMKQSLYYPDWWNRLGKSPKEIQTALEKIIEDAGKDKGKLVEDLKAILVEEATVGGVRGKGVTRLEIPPDEYYGRVIEAYRKGELDKFIEEQTSFPAPEPKPGEPVKFEKTKAGEQGVLIKEQAKYPRPDQGKRSNIPPEEQVKGTMFEKPKKPPSDLQSEIFSVASIALYPAVDSMPIDDDTKKALKAILGLTTVVGIASALSPRGKEILKDIEGFAKRKGTPLSKSIGEFFKSAEEKELSEGDRTILKKLAESPKVNIVATEVAKKAPKQTVQVKLTEQSEFKRVNDFYKRHAEKVDEAKFNAKITPLTEQAIQDIRGRTSAELLGDPEFATLSKSDRELIQRRLMKKIDSEIVPKAPRDVLSQVRERLPDIETEVLLSTTSGTEATVKAIREKALEQLRSTAGYSKLKPKTRAKIEERLSEEYIDKFLQRTKKNLELQKLREQSIDRVAEALVKINKAKMAENVPLEMQNKLLSIAQNYVDKNVNRGNQNTVLGRLTSMETALASTYGNPGGELFIRVMEGSSRKDAMVEVAKPFLNKIFETYEGIKSPFRQAEIGDAVAKALENRANAKQYLDTPGKQQAYDYTVRVMDYFKKAIEQAGRKVEENYFPRIYDQMYRDAALRDLMNSPSELRQLIEEGAAKKGSLLGVLSEKSARLKERTVPKELPLKTDLRALMPSYVASVSRELAFADAMQYFFEQFPRDLRLREVSVGQRPPLDRAIEYMRTNLYPDYTTGKFWKLIQTGIANTYMAHLWNNLSQSSINMAQRMFTLVYMSPETRGFKNEFKGKILPKRLASAIELATSEAPVRYSDLTPAEFEGSKLREKMAERDTFRASERGNWYSAETDGVFDMIVKDPRFKKLREQGKNAEEIAETILSSPDAFDKAVRNAAVLSVRTQMSPSKAVAPEQYRESAWTPLRVFTNYKRGAIQVLSQVMGKWDGISGTRAKTIMARGMVGDVGTIEGLRFAETYNKSFKEMLKDPELAKALNKQEMGHLQDYATHFDKLYKDLNETVKRLEPLSGSKLRASAELVRYFGLISAISLTSTLLFDGIEDVLAGKDDKERSTVWLIAKVFYDTFPMPFFGYNPANVFSSIPLRMFETTDRYGFSARNVAKDVVRYGGTAIFPPFGILDRATGRRLSGAVVDAIAPKKSQSGAYPPSF